MLNFALLMIVIQNQVRGGHAKGFGSISQLCAVTLLPALLLALAFQSCKPRVACMDVHVGEFLFVNHAGVADTRITRTGDTQVEVYEQGGRCTYSVTWLNECQYRLVRTSGDELCYTLLPESMPVVVTIVAVSQEAVEIRGEVEGTGYVTKGRLMRVH